MVQRFIVDADVLERQAIGLHGTHTLVLAADHDREIAERDERIAALEAKIRETPGTN